MRFSVNREGDNGSGNAGSEDRGERCLVEGTEEVCEAGHIRWIVENEWWMLAGEERGNGGCARERVPCVLRVLFCCTEPGCEPLASDSSA